jgi:hypothetical protein
VWLGVAAAQTKAYVRGLEVIKDCPKSYRQSCKHRCLAATYDRVGFRYLRSPGLTDRTETLLTRCIWTGLCTNVQRTLGQAGKCGARILNHILRHPGLCPGKPTPFKPQAKYQNTNITASFDYFSKSYSLPASNPSTRPSLHLPSASTPVPMSFSPYSLDGSPVSAFSLLSAQS